MESLKTKLHTFIKAQYGKVVPLNQIELLCKQWGYKSSNAERRLREMTDIGKHYNEAHTAIIGYFYKTPSQFCCISNSQGKDCDPYCKRTQPLNPQLSLIN